jgi:hypothetical protein
MAFLFAFVVLPLKRICPDAVGDPTHCNRNCSKRKLYLIPTSRRVGPNGRRLPVAIAFEASPDLHGRFKCCPCSSLALTATAPVRSLVHAWPYSAPLQPLLPLPFPAPPLLVIFCAHLTFHRSLSCPISHFPPHIPICFPDCVVPILAHLLP